MSKISSEGENWNVKCEKIILNSQFSILNFLTWRITDSNRWPPACKAGALASWANPPKRRLMADGWSLNFLHLTSYILLLNVVPGRLELPTSTLSVWRSNQLSYRTLSGSEHETAAVPSFYFLSFYLNIDTEKRNNTRNIKALILRTWEHELSWHEKTNWLM